MKKLIIAEKPSLARNIASALNVKVNKEGYMENGKYIISWAFGHLFKLRDVDGYVGEKRKWSEVKLPFFPEKFEFDLKNDLGIKKQYKILNNLINSNEVDEIVNAGDADREGQIIVDIIINAIKTDKKIKRLWLPEQTEETIRKAINNLEDNSKYKNLHNEGLARTYMDWLMGINLTRYISLKANTLFPVGRVLIPVIKHIYDKDLAIKNFIPEKYFTIESETMCNGTLLKLICDKKYNLLELEKAKSYSYELNRNKGIVKDITEKEIILNPPKLFSLSKLQSKLSKENKISFAKSLEIIQNLYEKGFITYPRTNTEYLAEEEKDKVRELIKLYSDYELVFKDSKKIFDSSKIESHSAVMPTLKVPDMNSLDLEEKIIFETIRNRFISNFLKEQAIINQTEIKIAVGNEIFNLKGKSVKQEGFLKYENQKIDNKLPYFEINQEIDVDFKVADKLTIPPKKVTEENLSNYLKNPFRKEKNQENEDDTQEYREIMKGVEIGTEATRTGIIEKAKKYRYITSEKQNFSITEKGIKLIELLDLLHINLYAEKTVEFSMLQKDIYNNRKNISDIIEKTKSELQNIINQDIEVEKFEKEMEVIGKCPKCNSNVYENSKSYYCSNYKKGCKTSLWKEASYFGQKIKISKDNAKKLLRGKQVVFKIKSKSGKEYNAHFGIEINGDYLNLQRKDFIKIEK
ncbi:type IA DNA topoisomerase [Leptotrichia sp. oral taxon 879]|uniref:type IA DNA topoisomerase n=1 Tax=Leptotrichia sp. oral taxon 879 TaxID=1227267 RepID=UPI0003AE7455|nr:DNA topoisomerase [Leptotrichia sp. oral taxon 879]ERK55810.1 DNA topoisomerase [Leptotrichia sp. oral taxon 879 str. F0557]